MRVPQTRHTPGAPRGPLSAAALALGLFAALVASARAADAQGDAAGAPDEETRAPSALIGLWEGFDSEGALVAASFTLGPRDDAQLLYHESARRAAGTTTERGETFAFRAGDDRTSYLLGAGAGAGEPVVVTWYSDYGVRLSWPAGRQAVLTRVSEEPPSSPGPMVAAGAGFNDVVQAGLLSLEGTWRGLGPGAASEGQVELRVLDPAGGRLEWAGEVGPLGAPLTGTTELVLLRANDLEWTFRAGDERLVLTWAEGQVLVRGADEVPGVTLRRP